MSKKEEELKDDVVAHIDFSKDMVPIDEPIFQEIEVKPADPTILDPEWEEFILSKFHKNELVKGRPKVVGMRRVIRLMFGPIVGDDSLVLQYPSLDNGQRATAKCTVTVLMTKNLESSELPYEITYTDCADAWHENITGIEFMRHPVAMACTRAESRALRKILSIATPAAEEIPDQPVDVDALNGTITESQITRIDIKCEQLDIDVAKYFKVWKAKKVKDTSLQTAAKMLKHLVDIEQGKKDVPEDLVGYKPNWRD